MIDLMRRMWSAEPCDRPTIGAYDASVGASSNRLCDNDNSASTDVNANRSRIDFDVTRQLSDLETRTLYHMAHNHTQSAYPL